jgi:hypothetical protein
MGRAIASVVGGLLLFSLAEYALGALAKGFWPEYAAAIANRTFTLPMLWSRLAAGAAATTFAALVAATLGDKNRAIGLWFGISLLVLSVLWHSSIWAKYPVWYHLTWFATIMPAALFGGWLSKRSFSD